MSEEPTLTTEEPITGASPHSQGTPIAVAPQVLARLRLPAPRFVRPGFHPVRVLKSMTVALGSVLASLFKSMIVALTPYTEIAPPDIKRADFPSPLDPAVHDVVAASLAHEDQRTARFDLKASAFLSTCGILIPLIATLLISLSGTYLKAALLTSVAFATLAGVASFRALQLKVGQKLSTSAVFAEDGSIRSDARDRHTLTLLLILSVEECTNDHRARLIRASSALLGAASLILTAAAFAIVA